MPSVTRSQAVAKSIPICELPDALLDRVVGCLELWDLAAARSACQALRAAAARRARRLVFTPASLECESGDGMQVGTVGVTAGPGGRRHVAAPPQPAGPTASRAPPPPPPQKDCPTAFQLFPNARDVVLVACDVEGATHATRHLDVPDLFFPPSAPADAAAARAALAGVTRLEVRGPYVFCGQLEDALEHLPGLRAVTLAFSCESRHPSEDGDRCDNLVAALAARPSIESLHWTTHLAGASGSKGGRRALGWAGP
jgi:hypothetical protein